MIGFKSYLSTILTGIVVLGGVASGISWWSMDTDARANVLDVMGRVGGWVGCVLILPGLLFFPLGRLARMDSNAAGAIFVTLLTAVELAGLVGLFYGSIQGSRGWLSFVFAGAAGGLYNLLACDWIAEKME